MPFHLVLVLACGHACRPPSGRPDRIFPSFHECFVAGFSTARGGVKFRCDRLRVHTAAGTDASQAASLNKQAGTLETLLSRNESGGNPRTLNRFGYAGLFQFGAPLLRDLRVYEPGPKESLQHWSSEAAAGKWQGTFHIPAHPEIKSIADFLNSASAQRTVFKIHLDRLRREIAVSGLQTYIGRTIDSVPITLTGLEMMMHLGGAGGVRHFLTTDGRSNPRDANGTSLLDYVRAARMIGRPVEPARH